MVDYWVVRHVRRPIGLLAAVVLVCGGRSAVLVNDTVCLVMAPLVLEVVWRLKRDPIPYLLAIAMASNIGSLATITGNPQNMIVGTLSHIPFGTFAATLAPIAAIAELVAVPHPAGLRPGRRVDPGRAADHRGQLGHRRADQVLHAVLQAATPSLFKEHEDVPRHGQLVDRTLTLNFRGGTLLDALNEVVRSHGSAEWQIGFSPGRPIVELIALNPQLFPGDNVMAPVAVPLLRICTTPLPAWLGHATPEYPPGVE